MSRKMMRKPVRLLSVLTVLFLFAGTGTAGIPEPPLIILGSLETPSGLPVTEGDLRFEFVPSGGGNLVRVDATVGSFPGGLNFFAVVPLEGAPLDADSTALELGGSRTYTPRVFFDGIPITPSRLDPFTPARAGLIGPVTYTVSPQGPRVSVSGDLDFGFVPVGSSETDAFTISNVGTESIAGTARLETSQAFRIVVGQVALQEVALNLAPGEMETVTVRFQPGVVSSLLTDTFEVRTNADPADRVVRGNSTNPASTGDPDLDGNGEVDHFDLFLLVQEWLAQSPDLNAGADLDFDNDSDQDDLFLFLQNWHR